MKKRELPTKKCYDNGQINLVSETSLKRYFVTHAKRYQKSSFFLRRNPPHPLRWHVVDSAFLQKGYSQNVSYRVSQNKLSDGKSYVSSHFLHLPYHDDIMEFAFLQVIQNVSPTM